MASLPKVLASIPVSYTHLQELWLETTSHIGQADVSDVGALYFEMKNGSDHRYWVFERGDFDMPVVYKTFMSKIQEKITLINQ